MFVGWLLCDFNRCPKLRKFVENIQSTKGPMCYTVFHDPVGRSSERIHVVFSLTIDLLGRETQCKRHTLVLSLIVTALLSVYH